MSSYTTQAEYEAAMNQVIAKCGGHTIKTVEDMNGDEWTCYTTIDGQTKSHYTLLTNHAQAKKLGFRTPYPDGSVWSKYP